MSNCFSRLYVYGGTRYEVSKLSGGGGGGGGVWGGGVLTKT